MKKQFAQLLVPKERSHFNFNACRKTNSKATENGDEEEKAGLLEKEKEIAQQQRPADAPAPPPNGGGPRKVHILSAVSVSLNDSPLTTTADENTATPTPSEVFPASSTNGGGGGGDSNGQHSQPPASPTVVICPRHQVER